MNNDVVIQLKNLGKSYRIGEKERYLALRDVLVRLLKNPFRIFNRKKGEEFWALKNINIEVSRGEVVGIIGKNGAGKSTLLKIISRITEPTTGELVFSGKVSSLLEVGTGFHPELTGRENVYLNGSILGMSRKEIDSKFEQIVEFSGIGEFLDTPVKRYSSGMQVRLAFSIAAHLEPDILIVDEVLAVGDAEFQKRCLGKMDEVTKKAGRTILFVSHNMDAVKRICNRCILLEKGQVVDDGNPEDVIDNYFKRAIVTEPEIRFAEDLSKKVQITRLFVMEQNKKLKNRIGLGGEIYLGVDFSVRKDISNALVSIEVYSEDGVCVFSTTDLDFNGKVENVKEMGEYTAIIPIDSEKFLKPGFYSFKANSTIPKLEYLDQTLESLDFEIVANEKNPSYALAHGRRGVIEPVFKWEIEKK